MTDVPSQGDDLQALVSAIDELLNAVGLGREAIDSDKLSFETGIPVDRVAELLDGAESEPESLNETFRQRLNFLRETRRKPDGKRFTLDEIGQGAGISKAQAGFLLNGQRMPGLAIVSALENFFHVEPGFFSATERQSLCRALQPVRGQLTHLAFLKGHGITRMAMRSGRTADESALGQELLSALSAVLNEPDREDPEVRQLTSEITSLPCESRRRVVSGLRSLLRRARGGE